MTNLAHNLSTTATADPPHPLEDDSPWCHHPQMGNFAGTEQDKVGMAIWILNIRQFVNNLNIN